MFAVYVDVGISVNNMTGLSATIDVGFGPYIAKRQLSIRVAQITCNGAEKPPESCLQYLTGTNGITSYTLDSLQDSSRNMPIQLNV